MFNHSLVDVQSFVSSSFDKKCILATNKLVVFLNLHDVQTQWLSVLSVVFANISSDPLCKMLALNKSATPICPTFHPHFTPPHISISIPPHPPLSPTPDDLDL